MRPTRKNRTGRRPGALIAAAGLTAVAVLAVPSTATATPVGPLGADLTAVVDAGATAALLRLDGDDIHRGLAAGQADVPRGVPMRPDATFRIGSTTKTFVATVVLQLVGEGRIGLDVPIERYLPGLIPGGAQTTVRQILDHRSGLHDYVYALGIGSEDWFRTGRWQTWTADRMVAAGVRQPPYFTPPGSGFHYSNTDYVVAGMLIEKVTGRSYADEVTRRVLRPLGLTDTRFPGSSPAIPGPHAHAYAELTPTPIDVTEFNPSQAGASGEMLSTGRDLTRFIRALLAGRLLAPTQLREMTTTLDTGLPYRYGLGLESEVLPCGTTIWGHPGGSPGFITEPWTTDDGRRAAVDKVLARALCP
ncbi:serine hydrolase domain-containing protein [Embleya sp. AB8]|uniref:serine hydrolase domain-containing protein n=1 Tax=Embleya sp. AB8 TaxID=3156304 RepID=UPI003C754B99